MKQLPIFLAVVPLLMVLLVIPGFVSAKEDDDSRDDDEDSALEVEADVYTDTTIVKVELNDKKTIFATTANTRDGVVAAVVAKYGLETSVVEAALELEIEDRASRPHDRGQLNRDIKKEKYELESKKGWGHRKATTTKMCRDDDSSLKIEADIFTDTTVVKVEFVNAKDEVFTTSATTSTAILAAVADRYKTLATSSIEKVLEVDTEDRASRDEDKTVDTECVSTGVGSSTKPVANEAKLNELRARIAELQTMLERIIALMRGN